MLEPFDALIGTWANDLATGTAHTQVFAVDL
jgi:hypothetical protein